MNKFYTKMLLLLLAPLCLFMGCDEDDDMNNESPSIVFSTTRSSVGNIDLDMGTGPTIRGWAVAPAGLSQVTITADKTSGGEEILNVTSFDGNNTERNGTAYEFVVLPEYTPDFTGITVTVIDVNNRSEQIMMEVSAIGGSAGPVMEGFAAGPIEANVRPSVDIRPAISGTISSHWGLESITFVEVYDETEDEVASITDFGDTPNQYSVDYTPDYDRGYTEGMTGFKINAVDKKGNTSTYAVDVSVIDASAAPIITFDEEMIEADLLADPQVTPAISGSVNAFEGLASVTFYVVGAEGDEQLGDQITSFDDNEYDFSFDDIPYALGVRGFKVVAVDNSNQTTTETLPVSVVAEDPALLTYTNVILNAQANRDDPAVNTAFSVSLGQAFSRQDAFDDPEVAAEIDFITVDSGGNDELDLFAPSHTGWLEGNYFNEFEWAHRNETLMTQIETEDNEAFFNSATSIDIEAMELEGSGDDRIDPLFVGDLVFFVTSQGQKGLLYLKAWDTNAEEGSKADIFTFDIKAVE